MREYACVGLDHPKHNMNVGAVLRGAGVFDATMVAISGRRYKTSATDTMKHVKCLPLIQTNDLHSVIPFDCVPVAIELVQPAFSLINYKHPERAFYVFGAEDATLGTRILSWCRDVVYIPSSGCLNLAACVNVVLYDRMAKLSVKK